MKKVKEKIGNKYFIEEEGKIIRVIPEELILRFLENACQYF